MSGKIAMRSGPDTIKKEAGTQPEYDRKLEILENLKKNGNPGNVSVPEVTFKDTPNLQEGPDELPTNKGYTLHNTDENEASMQRTAERTTKGARDIQAQNTSIDSMNKALLGERIGNNKAKNPVDGTFTGKSFANSLWASRLADAYNNKIYTRSADIGEAGYRANVGPQQNQMYQMPKINTEEARSIDRARNIQMQGEQQDQARQGAARDIALSIAKAIPETQFKLLQQQGVNEESIRVAIEQATQDIYRNMPGRQFNSAMYAKFLQHLGYTIRSQVLQQMASLFNSSPLLGSWVAEVLTGNAMFSRTEVVRDWLKNRMREIFPNDAQAQSQASAMIDGLISEDQVNIVSELFGNAIKGNVGTNPKDINVGGNK